MMPKEIKTDEVREGENRPMVLRSLIFATGGVAVLGFIIFFIVMANQPG